MRWVVGTDHGLLGPDGEAWLAGRAITALAPDGRGWIVLVDGSHILRAHGDEVDALGTIDEEPGRCVLPLPEGVLVGTGHARLALVRDGRAAMIGSFDEAEGRGDWYTPWGGPPDTRSLTATSDGRVFANVHVGGILRAEAPEAAWSATIDIDADVHQVLADPLDPRHVVAASARGLAESDDGGRTWSFVARGLHAPYARAVALDGERLFMSASTGPRGGRAAVYRREPGAEAFERCEDGLPDWFGGNIDSHCLAAGGGTTVFGTEDGRAFVSEDGGTWREAAKGLGRVTCAGVSASR